MDKTVSDDSFVSCESHFVSCDSQFVGGASEPTASSSSAKLACAAVSVVGEQSAESVEPSCAAPPAKPLSEVDAALAYGVPLTALQELALEFLDSPPAERARYLARKSVAHCPQKAAALLRTYMANRINEMSQWPDVSATLPQVLRFNGHARDGTRVVHFMPSAIDLQYPPEMYANAMVRLVESNIPRESTTRMTILLDTRSHKGCPNKSFLRLWRHLAMLATMFQNYFPERITRGILFPVGSLEQRAFNAFSYLVSPTTTKKLVLAWGSQDGPLPEDIWNYLDHSEIWPENQHLFPTGTGTAPMCA